MRFPRSLQTKSILFIVAIIVAVLAVSTYSSIRLSENTAIESLKNKALIVAEQLDKGIRGWEDIKDLGALRKQIRDLVLAQRGITEIALFIHTPKGMEFVASSEDRSTATLGKQENQTISSGKTIATLEEGDVGRWWHVSTPIHIGQEVVGAISVRVSLKEADLLAREQRKQASFIALITICVLVVSLMFFFRRAILRPISTLIGAMKEAEAGNLAQEVSIKNHDEFGIMSENFNRMLKRIRESAEENLKLLETINRFNEDLRGKVAQATQELAGRNEELIRANELLFELQRKLSHSEKLAAVGQVSAAMAHEIGTPLNSIFGHLQLITEEADLKAEAKKRIELIKGQMDRVVGILQHLLASSRMPASKPVLIDINKVIMELLSLTTPGMTLKKVTPRTDLNPDIPRVLADPHQIQQVLLNLISNSIDAMPGGGNLTIATSRDDSMAEGPGTHRRWVGGAGEDKSQGGSIERAERATTMLRISVKDTGHGIPRENIRKVFEPFFTTKSEGHGSGLGLAICQEIVKAHGGKIEVESAENLGTEFRVFLPATGQPSK